MTGCIHIYCGDGKGKTTAATGLALRASGTGMKVLFTRFLKNETSGELAVLDQLEGIEVLHLPKSFGFYQTLSQVEKEEMRQMYQSLWELVKRKVDQGAYQMLVLDEIMAALTYHVLEETDVIHFLQHKPKELEIVMTGRNPAEPLLALADYVSEIKKVKHPFDQGMMARKGIEF